MRTRILLAALCAALATAALTGLVLATAQSGITPTTLAPTTDLAAVDINVETGSWELELKIKGRSDVSVVENRVAPGGTFGWHSHPGPSLIIVKSGTMTFYRANDPTCSPDVYTAGQALIDPGNSIHVGVNEGTVDAVVVVTRFVPDGAATRIDQPAPGNCGF
jgi:quercetin dioxygenase-like cupin family protein